MENVTLAETIIKSYEYTSSLYHIPSVYIYDSGTQLCWSYLQAMYEKSGAHEYKNLLSQEKVAFLLTLHALFELFLTLVLMDAARRVMKESLNEGPRKRCCVCYEMQVDSLLYRYGLVLEAKLYYMNLSEII